MPIWNKTPPINQCNGLAPFVSPSGHPLTRTPNFNSTISNKSWKRAPWGVGGLPKGGQTNGGNKECSSRKKINVLHPSPPTKCASSGENEKTVKGLSSSCNSTTMRNRQTHNVKIIQNYCHLMPFFTTKYPSLIAAEGKSFSIRVFIEVNDLQVRRWGKKSMVKHFEPIKSSLLDCNLSWVELAIILMQKSDSSSYKLDICYWQCEKWYFCGIREERGRIRQQM